MKAPEINKLREEFTMDDFAENEDNNYHTENALELAKWLESHAKIDSVNYPGLDSSPYKSAAEK